MRYIFLVTLLTTCCNIQSQPDSVVIGEAPNGKEIYSYERDTKFPISSISWKRKDNTLNIVTANRLSENLNFRSIVMRYNLDNGQLLWTIAKNDNVSAALHSEHGIITIEDNILKLHDSNDGNMIWEKKLYPIYRNDSLDLIIGYKKPYNNANSIIALRLGTGEQLWEGKIKRMHNLGWDRARLIENEKMIVVADDINMIDLRTGKTITFEAKTSQNDLLKTAIGIIGISLSNILAHKMIPNGFTPYYLPQYGMGELCGLTSNIMEKDSCHYIADRECLRCFSYDMEQLWRFDFPTGNSSYSLLYGNDKMLHMVNFGYGIGRNNCRMKHSVPFIATIDPITGNSIFFKTLAPGKEPINDAIITDKDAFFMFDDRIVRQCDINDSVIKQIPWQHTQYGRPALFHCDTIYVANQNGCGFTAISCENKYLNIITDKNNLVITDSCLNLIKVYKESDLYQVGFKHGDYKYIYKHLKKSKYDSWIVHNNGTPVIHLKQEFESIRSVGDYIVFICENKIRYIKL